MSFTICTLLFSLCFLFLSFFSSLFLSVPSAHLLAALSRAPSHHRSSHCRVYGSNERNWKWKMERTLNSSSSSRKKLTTKQTHQLVEDHNIPRLAIDCRRTCEQLKSRKKTCYITTTRWLEQDPDRICYILMAHLAYIFGVHDLVRSMMMVFFRVCTAIVLSFTLGLWCTMMRWRERVGGCRSSRDWWASLWHMQ